MLAATIWIGRSRQRENGGDRERYAFHYKSLFNPDKTVNIAIFGPLADHFVIIRFDCSSIVSLRDSLLTLSLTFTKTVEGAGAEGTSRGSLATEDCRDGT